MDIHYWLIIWILTPNGQTLFDYEFENLSDCQKALRWTVNDQESRGREQQLMVTCRPYPLNSGDSKPTWRA